MALLKDTLREIRKSFGRFFSIFAIVAIGVAFFAGIIATAPDMKYSADSYFDNYNFMDYTIYSTFGLTEDDIKAISEVEEVEGVMPAHTKDVMGKIGDYEFVIKLHGIPDNLDVDNENYINQVLLKEGRLPENENECLMEYQMKGFGIEVGQEVTLSSGNKDDLSEEISVTKLTVVGLIQIPYYLSFEKGSTTIGKGSVDAYALVFDSIFTMDYYTEAYVTIKDSKYFNSYEEEYFEFLNTSRSDLKTVAREQSELRYEEIMETARTQLDEKKAEYEAAVAKFDEEITAAEQEIEAGKYKLLVAQLTLDSQKETTLAQIESGKEQLEILKLVIDETEVQYAEAEKLYNEQYASQITRRNQLQARVEEINAAEPNLDQKVEQLQSIVNSGGTLTPDEQEQLDILLALQSERDQNISDIDLIDRILSYAQTAMNQIRTQLDSLKKQYDEQITSIAVLEQQANEGFAAAQKEIDKATAELLEGEVQLKLEKKKAELDLADAEEMLKKAELDIENIANPEWYVLDRKSHYSYREYESAANQIAAIGDVFPVFFMIVAALVALTTMTRMVDEQRNNIGTLKALGYSKPAIASKYIIYALISSALGAVLGLLIGLYLFPSVIINAWNIMYTIPEVRLVWQPILMAISVSIGILVTTVAAFSACYKDLMETPALLMRPKAPKAGKTILLEKVPAIWKRLTFSEKVTMRNLFRYKKRLLMTVVGISGCTALILAGFGIRDSINSIITTQFTELYQYDATISVEKDASSVEKEDFLDELKAQEGVRDAMMIASDNATLFFGDDNLSITLIVPTDNAKFQDFMVLRNIDTKKEYYLADDGVIISQKMANKYDIKVGDSVAILTIDNYQKSFTVNQIAENYVGNDVFMSYETYQQNYGLKPVNSTVYVKMQVTNGSDYDSSVGNFASEQEIVRSISFLSSTADSFTDMISALDLVIVVLILSAGALAFVVLYNLNNVNISERIREIATIKVLGFNDREVAQYVNRESIMLTMIGALAGLALGRLLHLFIMNVIEVDQIMFTRDVFFSSHVIAVAITMVFGFIVNFAMEFKLRRIPMVESLKSVE